MMNKLGLLIFSVTAGCGNRPSLQPAVRVVGLIDGPGRFEILVPQGYVPTPALTSDSVQRWLRGSADPIVELDAASSDLLPTCARSRSDQSLADELGKQKDISVCRQSDGPVYVRRMTLGDEPLSCFVLFKQNEAVDSDRIKSGIAICESLRVDQHSLTSDLHAFSPHVGEHLRVDFASGAEASVDIVIPSHYVVERRPNDIFIRHRINTWLPTIGIMTKRTVCDEGTAVSKVAVEDGTEVVLCDLRKVGTLLVMRSVTVGSDEALECFITIETADRGAGGTPIPLPQKVVDRRKEDAVQICKSLKVHDYQKIGNPAK